MRASDLVKVVGGEAEGNLSVEVKGFCVDSRKAKDGYVFIALKGQRRDGHSFVQDAFWRGAVGVICERKIPVPKGKFRLKVPSSLEALRKVARHRRSSYRGRVIGVAGSVGKTTTKELIYHLLSRVARTFKSEGNLNSQIGLPLVLASMDTESEYAVLELGASERGDVLSLTKLSEPSVRVITAVGEEHLETFGTLEDVIEGNGEIFHGFGEEDFAVLPYTLKDRYNLPRERVIAFGEGALRPAKKKVSIEGTDVWVLGERFSLPVLSLGIVDNLLAAFGVLKALRYDPRDFKEALTDFRPPRGRMNVLKFEDFYIIDDTYNANPPSVKNAVRTISELETDSKRVVVLGDMLELGPQSQELHAQIGAYMKEKGVHFAIFYGRESFYAYREFVRRGGKAVHLTDKRDVFSEMLKWLKDKNIILLKGSRGMSMETLIGDVRGALGL